MRGDFASCFSEYAVKVSDASSCASAGSSTAGVSLESPPSIQSAVTCLYATSTTLPSPSSKNRLFVSLTWGRTAVSIAFDDGVALSLTHPKGTRTHDFAGEMVEVSWDLTAARFGSGPEPISGYFILIATVDSGDTLLLLGDKKSRQQQNNKFSLISRHEHFSGRNVYTRARFSDAGNFHSILIRCGRESDSPVLSVCIDRKPVVHVKKLHWNFRGNETVFLDGVAVDLLWDVHEWLGYSGAGTARFLFRTRTGLENRPWLEHNFLHKDGAKLEFSFMVHARNSNQ